MTEVFLITIAFVLLTPIIRFYIRKSQFQFTFAVIIVITIIITYIIMIAIIHSTSSLLFSPYNIVCEILFILFWLIFVYCKLFVHCNQYFNRKKLNIFHHKYFSKNLTTSSEQWYWTSQWLLLRTIIFRKHSRFIFLKVLMFTHILHFLVTSC